MSARYSSGGTALLAVTAALAALIVVAWALIAYRFGIEMAVGMTVAIGVAAAVAYRPATGACLVVLAAPVDALATNGGSFSLTPSEAILFLTAASASVRLAMTVTLADIPAPFYAFGALTALTTVGFFVAVDTFVVARLLLTWIAVGIVGLFVALLPLRQAKLVALSLAISGGILGLMTLGNLSEQEVVAGGAIVSNRAAASFAHPTSLALFLLMSFPLAFAFGLRGPKRWRLPMMGVAAVTLLGLALTQTRGAMISTAVALVWMMWVWQPFRRFALVALAIVAVVFGFNLGGVSSQKSVSVVGDRLSTLTLSSEGDQRLEIWSTVPKIVADHPLFGVGQGNFALVSPQYDLHDVGGLPFDHAHDLFFNIAVELGLPALLLLGWLIVSLFATARTALRDRAGPVYPFAVAVSASLLALLVNSLTEYPLRQNLILTTIAIVIALLVAFARASPPPTHRP